MILLFNGMQVPLSMVYDREMGSMRVLLTSPLPRTFLLCSKLLRHRADFTVAGVRVPGDRLGLRRATACHGAVDRPAGLAAGGLDAERAGFAAVERDPSTGELCRGDEFRDLPAVFISSALYPLWKMRDSSEWLYWLCAINPFTHAVELVRFALYERFAGLALAVCLGLTVLFAVLAVLTFNPQHAALRKKG